MLLVFGLLVSFFVLVFSELRRKAAGLINIEASEAVRLINNDAAVIDLRNAEAYSRGHIVNAKNIPLDELDGRKDQPGIGTKWQSRRIVHRAAPGKEASRYRRIEIRLRWAREVRR